MAHPTTRPPKTVEDFMALPDDTRAELIGGELYVTPSPRPVHQRSALRLGRLLAPPVEDGHLGEVFIAPLDVHLPTGDIVEPDLVFVAQDQADIVREDAIHGVPRLLIEVVSPSHPERDRIVKMDLYARNGVAEYWLVDPEARSVEIFVLEDRRFQPFGWFTGEAEVVSRALPDLRLPLDQVFPSA